MDFSIKENSISFRSGNGSDGGGFSGSVVRFCLFFQLCQFLAKLKDRDRFG
jgi:hypothetical protein